MKTGIELIAQERNEQIEKHGFTIESDLRYEDEELRWAAIYCLTGRDNHWPSGWSKEERSRIDAKSPVERFAISGALIAAEIDRLQTMEKLKGGK